MLDMPEENSCSSFRAVSRLSSHIYPGAVAIKLFLCHKYVSYICHKVLKLPLQISEAIWPAMAVETFQDFVYFRFWAAILKGLVPQCFLLFWSQGSINFVPRTRWYLKWRREGSLIEAKWNLWLISKKQKIMEWPWPIPHTLFIAFWGMSCGSPTGRYEMHWHNNVIWRLGECKSSKYVESIVGASQHHRYRWITSHNWMHNSHNFSVYCLSWIYQGVRGDEMYNYEKAKPSCAWATGNN